MNWVFYLGILYNLSSKYEVMCYPYGSSNENMIIQPLGGLGDMVDNFVKSLIKSKTPMRDFPDSGRKQAVLELQSKESLPIQLDNKYGRLQEFVAGIFNPKPIVDITEEHEKYGNDGVKSRKLGTAVVAGFEGFSNGLNAAVGLPFVAAKEYGKKITSSLNIVGGKLVGLSK